MYRSLELETRRRLLMAKRKSGTRKFKNLKQFIKREGPPLFVLLSMVVGAGAFLTIAGGMWNVGTSKWWMLIIIASLMRLPNAFKKLKENEEPNTLKFARGFREGFLSLASIAPDISMWTVKVREFWKTLHKK